MWHPRILFRLLRVALHVVQAGATVAFFYPWLAEKHRLALKKRWSRQLLGMLGVRLHYQARHPVQDKLPRGLIVANHISFLDIFVVNAIAPTAFISKDDVRAWPLIGWLCAHTDTLFLERGSRNAAQRTRENVAQHLRRGKRVALFPEGTTTCGDSVLPFHSALFQSAIDAGTPVTPLVLRYRTRDGNPSSAAAYVNDMSLLQCLRNIAACAQLQVEVRVCAPLTTLQADRRELSAHAHRIIAHALQQAEPSPALAAHVFSPVAAPVPAG